MKEADVVKKNLTTDIRRYDDKMKLKFDLKTTKAVGIAFVFAAAAFALLWFTAGEIPAVVVSAVILGGLILLQVGTIQGISPIKYLSMWLMLTFIPTYRNKPYCRDKSGEYNQIVVDTDAELRQERRKK